MSLGYFTLIKGNGESLEWRLEFYRNMEVKISGLQQEYELLPEVYIQTILYLWFIDSKDDLFNNELYDAYDGILCDILEVYIQLRDIPQVSPK